MPSYRFYMLDAVGTTCDYIVQNCLSDQAARERAARLMPGVSGVEIWRARRLVARLNAATTPQTPEQAGGGWFDLPMQPQAAAAS